MGTKFITFEGMEGAGKSTCIDFACELLEQRGLPYVLTREPGGTAVAEQLREILLHQHDEPIAPATELLLMFAGRAQHLEQVIKPALAAGQWVLCDRFTDATYAYQGAARGLGVDNVEWLEQLVQGSLRPDQTLILDVSYEVGMQRVGQRGDKDRFERESEDFFNRVREAYLARAAANPDRYTRIDAGLELPAVREQVTATMQQLIDAQ